MRVICRAHVVSSACASIYLPTHVSAPILQFLPHHVLQKKLSDLAKASGRGLWTTVDIRMWTSPQSQWTGGSMRAVSLDRGVVLLKEWNQNTNLRSSRAQEHQRHYAAAAKAHLNTPRPPGSSLPLGQLGNTNTETNETSLVFHD